MVALTLFVYRRRDADGDTDEFRMPVFPLITGLFVLAAAAIVVSSIASNPGNAAIGAALIALGVPVFFFWQRR